MPAPLSKADWRVFELWMSQLDESELARLGAATISAARFRHLLASDVDFGFLISLALQDLAAAARLIRNKLLLVKALRNAPGD